MSETYNEIVANLDISNFNQNLKNYNRETSIFCGQLSTLSYWTKNQIASFLELYRKTYPNTNTYAKLINEPKSGSQVLLWGNKDFLIISFRGTEVGKWRDWWTDIKYRVFQNMPEYDETLAFLPAGSAGFRRALMNLMRYENFYAEIDDMISKYSSGTNKEIFPIYTTGHSLGAALSQLFMVSLKKSNYNFSGAYHYAPPLAVSIELNPYMKRTFGDIVHDVVNYKDYVPRAGRMGVAHFGKFYRIYENGEMHIEKERYLRFKKYEYFKELKLHKMANHLKALKKEENTFELIKNRSNKRL